MTDDALFDLLAAAIREETENPDFEITRATTADDVPGWDSLAHVRILLSVGIRLGIDIDASETYEAADVGELFDILRARVAS